METEFAVLLHKEAYIILRESLIQVTVAARTYKLATARVSHSFENFSNSNV